MKQLLEYVNAEDSSIIEWNPIKNLAPQGMEILEAMEIVDCPPREYIKRAENLPIIKSLFKELKGSADLVIVTLDCIDAEISPESKLAKTLRKLKDREVIIMLTDCSIMYESESDIKD